MVQEEDAEEAQGLRTREHINSHNVCVNGFIYVCVLDIYVIVWMNVRMCIDDKYA